MPTFKITDSFELYYGDGSQPIEIIVKAIDAPHAMVAAGYTDTDLVPVRENEWEDINDMDCVHILVEQLD